MRRIALVAVLLSLGSGRLLGTLADDFREPDIVVHADGRDGAFDHKRVAVYLLRHAGRLLRPEHADSLLIWKERTGGGSAR